jgi:transposase
MAISLPDARLLSDEVLEALRLRALRGCELGHTEADVAQLLGVARETVCRWWSAYREGGTDALPHNRTGRPVGTGRTLSNEQAAHIQDLLDQHNPEQLGIAAPLWSRRAVAELIRDEYGIDMPVRTVGSYLRRWDYTPKRPRRHAYDQDPEEVREWLEEAYPGIQDRAEQDGATIYWCDETGAQADAHPGRGYARRGQPATMEVPERHVRMNLISAISNEGDVRFMTFKENMNAALFIVFLGKLLRATTGKIFLIVDRLPGHVAAAVEDWLTGREARIELFFLPRYAPEVNADEYLNNDLKGQVGAQGLPQTKPELRSRIQAFMQRLVHLPQHVKNYFQHPDVQYAAALD